MEEVLSMKQPPHSIDSTLCAQISLTCPRLHWRLCCTLNTSFKASLSYITSLLYSECSYHPKTLLYIALLAITIITYLFDLDPLSNTGKTMDPDQTGMLTCVFNKPALGSFHHSLSASVLPTLWTQQAPPTFFTPWFYSMSLMSPCSPSPKMTTLWKTMWRISLRSNMSRAGMRPLSTVHLFGMGWMRSLARCYCWMRVIVPWWTSSITPCGFIDLPTQWG